MISNNSISRTLPQGWIKCKFSDIATIRNGYAFSRNDFSREQDHDNGIPLIKQTQLDGNKVDLSKACYLPTNYLKEYSDFLIQKNDVLIGMSGSIGKLCIYQHDFPALQNQRTGLIKTYNNEINNKFFWLFLQTIETKLMSGSKGVGVQNISSNDIEDIDFFLPPIPEQQRIVAKIDSLFSELENGETLLKTIKAQLVVYRQAVLEWAFEGKLTNNDWEMGILEDIVSEIKIGPFGTLLHKADYIENGIPIINPKHMNNQKIIYDSHTTITKQKAKDLSSYKLQENDIILARRGEMGRTAPVTEKEVGWLCGTGSMIVRLKTVNLNSLYSLFLSSERVRKYLTENCKGTTMDNLNETTVKKIPVPVCSKSEQLAIVSAIESRLSICEKLEQTIDQTLALSASLRQSILKKAFEGRLVPQDPDDEPAEKLLERIKAEKEAVLAKQKQTRKRGRK